MPYSSHIIDNESYIVCVDNTRVYVRVIELVRTGFAVSIAEIIHEYACDDLDVFDVRDLHTFKASDKKQRPGRVGIYCPASNLL